MNCPKCGKELYNTKEGNVCIDCDIKITKEQIMTNQIQKKESEPKKSTHSLKKIPRFSVVTLIIITMAVLVSGVYLTYKSQASSHNDIKLLTPHNYQITQRDQNNRANIEIRGTYTGKPNKILARWKNNSWTVVDSAPANGRFSGYLYNMRPGQGELQVCFSNNKNVVDTAKYVGIGDVFVVTGGSNGSGRADNHQSYRSDRFKASMYGNDYKWKELTDPTDSCSGQVDSVSKDCWEGRGSIWPLLATRIMANQDVPVAFIPTAKGGADIYEWQKNTSTSTLYGAMLNRVKKSGTKVRLVLMQGADGVKKQDIDKNQFKAAFNKFANDIYADFGVKVALSQSQDFPLEKFNVSAENTARIAQQELWDENKNIIQGPLLYDINLAGGVDGDEHHFRTNNEITTAAIRWWAALRQSLYNNGDGRGPKLTSVVLDSSKRVITATFSDSSLPLVIKNSKAFKARDTAGTLGITSIKVVNKNQVKITLSRACSGNSYLSYGMGSSGLSSNALRDSSNFTVPADVFRDFPISQ